MTTVTPNPPSPYADADPALRHRFPPLFGAPLPDRLAPTGCRRLSVVPPETARISLDSPILPDGLCPGCVADMRGEELPEDARPIARCRECDDNTDHDGLCLRCRMAAHDKWWPTRGAPKEA